jgi:hypothetical protein
MYSTVPTQVFRVEIDQALHIPSFQQAWHKESAVRPRNILENGPGTHPPLRDEAQPVNAQQNTVLNGVNSRLKHGLAMKK